MPTAISAALVPETPPPRITTFAGGTPGTPPSSTPIPPFAFCSEAAPTCTDMRPATSLIGVSSGSEPSVAVTVSYAIAVDAGRHQRLRLLGIGSEMQISEQDLARTQHLALGKLRLLHLHDHVRAVEHFLRRRDDLRAGGDVRRVVDADARTGRALDQHLMAGRNQLTHACRHQADAVLVILDLLRDADAHAQPREGMDDRRIL